MNAPSTAHEARAFGWELAEVMLDALRSPVSPVEAEAIGRHAAEVIEERVRGLPGLETMPDAARLWVDAASWGFRDRMAIARELAGPDGAETRVPARRGQGIDPDEAALRLIGGRDRSERIDEPSPSEPAKAARPSKAKTKVAKGAAKPAPAGRKRRPKPAPVA